MIPFYEHAGYTWWTMRPSLQEGCIHIPEGTITNSTGTYLLPTLEVEEGNINSITIVTKNGVAYYVLWQEGCKMEEGYEHIIELAWKEGNVWRYVENASSRSSN